MLTERERRGHRRDTRVGELVHGVTGPEATLRIAQRIPLYAPQRGSFAATDEEVRETPTSADVARGAIHPQRDDKVSHERDGSSPCSRRRPAISQGEVMDS